MTKSAKSRRQAPRSTAKHTAPKDKAAKEHYHREKARREHRSAPESDVMAAARREYLALLESDAAKGKGGRPKKKVAPIAEPDDSQDDADKG